MQTVAPIDPVCPSLCCLSFIGILAIISIVLVSELLSRNSKSGGTPLFGHRLKISRANRRYRKYNNPQYSKVYKHVPYYSAPYYAPEVKGAEFEKFVLDMFDEKDFSIIEMTHKFSGPDDRYVESDLNPDFVFRHKLSGNEFAVEAKYRSRLNEAGMLEWSNPDQLARYNNFANQRGIPVYIVIGIGGMP